jgi:hypothetical protein
MEAIREQLVYKEGKIQICMKDLKPVEQYELIRLLVATRTKDVFICKHDSINSYISKVLGELNLVFTNCGSSVSEVRT